MKRRALILGSCLLSVIVSYWYLAGRVDRQSLLLQANRHARTQQWQQVADLLENYVENHHDEEAIALFAEALSHLQQHLRAAEVWSRTPSDSPRYPTALLEQAKALVAARDAVAAEQALQRCLQVCAQSGRVTEVEQQAWQQLANLYWIRRQSGRLLHNTLRWSDRMLDQGKPDWQLAPLTWMLRNHLKDMHSAEGIEWTQAFVATHPDDLPSKRALAWYLADAGKLDQATTIIDGCMKPPVERKTLTTWLEIQHQKGARQRVLTALRHLDISSHPELELWKAKFLLDAGDKKQAVATLERVLQLAPDNSEAITQILPLLDRSAYLSRIEELSGKLQQLHRNVQKLRVLYQRLQDGWIPGPEASTAVATQCQQLGHLELAWAWHRRAVHLSPSAVQSQQALTELKPQIDRLMEQWENPPSFVLHIPAKGPSASGISETASHPYYSDVSRDLGVDFEYDRGPTGQFWIVEPNGGGVAWIDVDLDDYPDLYFVNGRDLTGKSASLSTNRVFHNLHGTRFVDRTTECLLGDTGYGQGCAVGDFNSDGFPDLYVTNYGPDVLYRNNGDGTFESYPLPQTAEPSFSTGAVFADLNGDGILDLYVANYLHFDERLHGKPCRNALNDPEYCGPKCCPPTADRLLLGNAAGGFIDVSEESGIAAIALPGFAVLAADLNTDGRPDLYVANDGEPNSLLLHRGNDGSIPQFEEVGTQAGCAYDSTGVAQASMGISYGDYDRDGDQDLGVTNYYLEHFSLYRHEAPATFSEVSIPLGLATATRTSMGWGTAFTDADNDGWLDLFMTNGHINPATDGSYLLKPQLFRNRADGTFEDVSSLCGPFFQKGYLGRGSAFADFNNDGLQDVVQIHHQAPAALLRNETPTSNSSLRITLIGRVSNRDGYHTRVETTCSTPDRDVALVVEHAPGGTYLSHHDSRIHLGTGARLPKELTVHWPSGRTSTVRVFGGQLIVVEPLTTNPAGH